MCRKFFTGMVLLGLGAYLWMGTSVGSYIRTGVGEASTWIKGQVPIETEIKRAKQLLAELGPDITRAKKNIAMEQVLVDRAQKEVVTLASNLELQRTVVLTLNDKVKSDVAEVKLGDRTMSKKDAQKELARQFSLFERSEETLNAKKKTASAREMALVAAKEKYQELVSYKEKLGADLDALEAEYKTTQVQQLGNSFKIEDTRLTQLRSAMDDLEVKIQGEKALSTMDEISTPTFEKHNTKDLTDKIDQKFGKSKQGNAKGVSL